MFPRTNFQGALSVALRSDEYATIAGCDDGPSALDELEAELVQALADLREIRGHKHDWDYVCDGSCHFVRAVLQASQLRVHNNLGKLVRR